LAPTILGVVISSHADRALGRFLPGGVVSVLAVGWLISAVPLLGFLVEKARRWRSAA
jgi:hypothetical protein